MEISRDRLAFNPGRLHKKPAGGPWIALVQVSSGVNVPQDPVARYLRSGQRRSSRAESGFDCFRQGEIR